MKKVNGILSLLALAVLTLHITVASTGLLRNTSGSPPVPVLLAVAVLTLAHALTALLSLYAVGEGSQIKKYRAMQKQTLLQRVCGIGMLPVIFAHIGVGACIGIGLNNGVGMQCVSAGLSLLLLVLLMPHLKLSFAKAFVTLGIFTKEKSILRAERFAAVFFPLLCAYAAAGDIVQIVRLISGM